MERAQGRDEHGRPAPSGFLRIQPIGAGLEHLRRLDVTPGVTGLWQVKARRNPSFASYIQLDREYVDNWSFWLDFRILWQTIGVVLAGNGE